MSFESGTESVDADLGRFSDEFYLFSPAKMARRPNEPRSIHFMHIERALGRLTADILEVPSTQRPRIEIFSGRTNKAIVTAEHVAQTLASSRDWEEVVYFETEEDRYFGEHIPSLEASISRDDTATVLVSSSAAVGPIKSGRINLYNFARVLSISASGQRQVAAGYAW